MRVWVQVKKGSTFNRNEGGRMVTYRHGEPFQASEHVLNAFRDRLILMDEETALTPAADLPAVPGTDDELNDYPDTVLAVIRDLAAVGLNVDPRKVAEWSDDLIERAYRTIARGGRQPAKYIRDALWSDGDGV